MTQVRLFTVDEYFALERASDVKHEYIDGEIIDMPGATPAHGLIDHQLMLWLGIQFLGEPRRCFVLGSDTRVRVSERQFVYADLTITCGELAYTFDRQPPTLINPTLVIEILSDSTADYDRGDKLALYQSMDSVQQVMHVDQHSPAIDVHTRVGESWTVTTVSGLDSAVTLESIGVTLNLRDIYRDVKFE
jgi:Uma2 family endonuclease